MITYTEMKRLAAELCGIDETSKFMQSIKANINVGVKRFQNASRRYWTRREKKTNIVAGQQFYQFPTDMLRVREVVVLVDGQKYPLIQVRSEEEWNRLNLVKSFATNIPRYFFIKGNDELGIYPRPASDVADGLHVAYEPIMPDMGMEDVEIKVDVANNDATVTRTNEQDNPTFNDYMTNNCYIQILSDNGNDGNWYKIRSVLSSNNIKLENVFIGKTEQGAKARIGQCPQFPEEYHIAPVYYAVEQFFLIRKDLDSAEHYKRLFDDALREYMQVYGVKTTGGVITPRRLRVPNLFNVPPIGLEE